MLAAIQKVDRQQFSELRCRWCMLAAIICSAALKTVACHPFESQNGQSAKVAGFEENLPMCGGGLPASLSTQQLFYGSQLLLAPVRRGASGTQQCSPSTTGTSLDRPAHCLKLEMHT